MDARVRLLDLCFHGFSELVDLRYTFCELCVRDEQIPVQNVCELSFFVEETLSVVDTLYHAVVFGTDGVVVPEAISIA